MAKYKIGWMPGDGVGVDVMDATRTVLDKLGFDAEYVDGDIGWEFWRTEANPLPDRTIEMLNNVDAALFGAGTAERLQSADRHALEKDEAVTSNEEVYIGQKLHHMQISKVPYRGETAEDDGVVSVVRDADCVVTDTWVSMGDKEAPSRHNLLRPYQVNDRLMSLAKPEAVFMHCLPAHRGEEVTDSVIDGPQSVVFDEAENRLHAQKGILLWCLE